MNYYNQIKGSKTYRHNDNPDEKKFYDSFLEHVRYNYDTMDQIAFTITATGTPTDRMNDREKRIMLNTIQWLGSPVGQGFLRDNGFTKQK